MSVPTITTSVLSSTSVSHQTTGSHVEMSGGSIDVLHMNADTTFHVTGSVDLANADTFAEVVGRDRTETTRIILDLTDVDFFGTAALSVVAGLDDRCNRSGIELTLVTGDAVTRVMNAARWIPAARRAENASA